MRVSALAERYAKALYEAANEENKAIPMGEFLVALDTAISSNSDLMNFARSPMVKPADKKEVFSKVAQALKVDEMTKNFLLVLAENDRAYLVSDIRRAYQALIDDSKGVTRGSARSAQAMTQDEMSEIAQVMSKLTGKKVILDFEVDPSLIGSVVAKVGSLTIDDSLKTHLNRLEDDLNRRVH